MIKEFANVERREIPAGCPPEIRAKIEARRNAQPELVITDDPDEVFFAIREGERNAS